jgi:hypothetical protein
MLRATALVLSLGLVLGAAVVPTRARAERAVAPAVARLVFDEGSVTRESGEDPDDLYARMVFGSFAGRRTAFLSCYARVVEREREVGDGEVVLEFRIPRRGRSTATVRSTTLTREAIVNCARLIADGGLFEPAPRTPLVFAVRLRYERIQP